MYCQKSIIVCNVDLIVPEKSNSILHKGQSLLTGNSVALLMEHFNLMIIPFSVSAVLSHLVCFVLHQLFHQDQT